MYYRFACVYNMLVKDTVNPRRFPLLEDFDYAFDFVRSEFTCNGLNDLTSAGIEIVTEFIT